MIIQVNGNMEGAIRTLKTRTDKDGLFRLLNLRSMAKPSTRRRAKAYRAKRRHEKARYRKFKREV
jgi:ribosomal protein S21